MRRWRNGWRGATPTPCGHGVWPAPRGGQNLSVDDQCSTRVAPVDPRSDDSSFSGGENSHVIMHQCGLLGVRVGEASHPGPRVRDKHRRRVASWSDDEPLVRPIVSRDVIPRTEAGSAVTEEFDMTDADSPDEAQCATQVQDRVLSFFQVLGQFDD